MDLQRQKRGRRLVPKVKYSRRSLAGVCLLAPRDSFPLAPAVLKVSTRRYSANERICSLISMAWFTRVTGAICKKDSVIEIASPVGRLLINFRQRARQQRS